jgi:hypothetical protein
MVNKDGELVTYFRAKAKYWAQRVKKAAAEAAAVASSSAGPPPQ